MLRRNFRFRAIDLIDLSDISELLPILRTSRCLKTLVSISMLSSVTFPHPWRSITATFLNLKFPTVFNFDGDLLEFSPLCIWSDSNS